jgi:hypothetical protein
MTDIEMSPTENKVQQPMITEDRAAEEQNGPQDWVPFEFNIPYDQQTDFGSNRPGTLSISLGTMQLGQLKIFPTRNPEQLRAKKSPARSAVTQVQFGQGCWIACKQHVRFSRMCVFAKANGESHVYMSAVAAYGLQISKSILPNDATTSAGALALVYTVASAVDETGGRLKHRQKQIISYPIPLTKMTLLAPVLPLHLPFPSSSSSPQQSVAAPSAPAPYPFANPSMVVPSQVFSAMPAIRHQIQQQLPTTSATICNPMFRVSTSSSSSSAGASYVPAVAKGAMPLSSAFMNNTSAGVCAMDTSPLDGSGVKSPEMRYSSNAPDPMLGIHTLVHAMELMPHTNGGVASS